MKSAWETYWQLKLRKLLYWEWKQWPAFKKGIIDDKGNLIKKPKTSEEKASFNYIDDFIRRVKIIVKKYVLNKSLHRPLFLGYLMKSPLDDETKTWITDTTIECCEKYQGEVITERIQTSKMKYRKVNQCDDNRMHDAKILKIILDKALKERYLPNGKVEFYIKPFTQIKNDVSSNMRKQIEDFMHDNSSLLYIIIRNRPWPTTTKTLSKDRKQLLRRLFNEFNNELIQMQNRHDFASSHCRLLMGEEKTTFKNIYEMIHINIKKGKSYISDAPNNITKEEAYEVLNFLFAWRPLSSNDKKLRLYFNTSRIYGSDSKAQRYRIIFNNFPPIIGEIIGKAEALVFINNLAKGQKKLIADTYKKIVAAIIQRRNFNDNRG